MKVSIACAARKKIRGGELASDGVGMISSDGGEWQLFCSDGGGEMPDALHFPPISPHQWTAWTIAIANVLLYNLPIEPGPGVNPEILTKVWLKKLTICFFEKLDKILKNFTKTW